MDIREIPGAATLSLRRRVLRPHHPEELLVFPGDDAPLTRHFGAFDDGVHVGIASVYREPKSGMSDQGAWRLRGMGTLSEVRRRGVGAKLLEACIAHAVLHGGTSLWCNARVVACDFYAALGFAREGAPFDLEDIGPHYVMWRAIGAR